MIDCMQLPTQIFKRSNPSEACSQFGQQELSCLVKGSCSAQERLHFLGRLASIVENLDMASRGDRQAFADRKIVLHIICTRLTLISRL